MKNLDGKIILVTGAARGLGEAISRELCGAGAHVILADIRMDLVNKVASDLKAQGGKATPLELDVMQENQIKTAVENIRTEFGRLDVLINSAGTDKTVSIEEMTVEDWDCIMAVNLR